MQKKNNDKLNRKTIEVFKKSKKIPLVLILDNVRSLNNIGSIFRTADAFLIEKIYLCGICATPPNREINKTALGATESVDWEYTREVKSLLNNLKKIGTKIYALEQVYGSTSLEKFKIKSTEKYAFILGNEVKGVSQEALNLCDGAIEIPQEGTKHSLNISVANGLALWDFYKKIKKL